jgi:hypothetical protein
MAVLLVGPMLGQEVMQFVPKHFLCDHRMPSMGDWMVDPVGEQLCLLLLVSSNFW